MLNNLPGLSCLKPDGETLIEGHNHLTSPKILQSMYLIWKLRRALEKTSIIPGVPLVFSWAADVNATTTAMGRPVFTLPLILFVAMLVVTEGKNVRCFSFFLLSLKYYWQFEFNPCMIVNHCIDRFFIVLFFPFCFYLLVWTHGTWFLLCLTLDQRIVLLFLHVRLHWLDLLLSFSNLLIDFAQEKTWCCIH